ncbi:oligosaccharide repeat unit polymerase [Paraburkholderia sp. RL17-337-BIB-A]|uniref:oligosaccharide repeat unit polymerase n=1 Tax=Paraburkholderia sp. RL17-337-BIB-A TaxID=3031636 RepID=UPI0038BD0D8F
MRNNIGEPVDRFNWARPPQAHVGVPTREQLAFNGYWWEDPARLMLFFIMPLYTLISIDLLGDQKAIAQLYFNSFYAFAGALFLVVVTAVSYLGRTVAPPVTQAPVEISRWVLDVLFVLSLIGYLTMMSGVITHPTLMLSFFNGDANTYDLMAVKGRIAGISTLTQVAVAYVPLYFYVFQQPALGISRYKIYLLVLLGLALLRSFVFAERLALIELVIPLTVMYLKFRRSHRPSRIIALGPYAAIVPLVAFFIANEYNRSWESYYVKIYSNIFTFALDRLALYYSTALNNGAGVLKILGWGVGDPVFTLDWWFRFPVLGDFFQAGRDFTADYVAFLSNNADPEFNNPSGIFVHFYEWGWFALFVAAFIGWVFNRSYSGWRAGNGFWCCAHSVFLVSLCEILRIPILFSGRNFVSIAVLFIVFRFCRTKSARSSRAVV